MVNSLNLEYVAFEIVGTSVAIIGNKFFLKLNRFNYPQHHASWMIIRFFDCCVGDVGINNLAMDSPAIRQMLLCHHSYR